MKIALVIERFDTDGGGAERSLAQIAKHLLARGHAVTVVSGSYCVRPQMPDVGFQSLFSDKRVWGVSVLQLARWVRKHLVDGPYDCSLSVTTALPAMVLQPRGGTVRETLARNVALRRNARLRTFKRLVIATSPKQRALLSIEKRTLRDPMVMRIVAVSQYVVQQLQRHYGIDPSRVDVIPNAADMPEVDTAQRQAWRQRVRSGFGVPEDRLVYLFAAHNPRLKGTEVLLRAVGRLRDRGIEATVLLAGRNTYAQQRLAATLGIRDRVRFVGTTNQMAGLYAAADVTVLPTYYDPASKVVIESLMMGVPAITTVFNGAADLVIGSDHRPRGRVLADPTAADALADAMAELADPQVRIACAQATAGLAEALSMKTHVDRLEAVLEAAADGTVRWCMTSDAGVWQMR